MDEHFLAEDRTLDGHIVAADAFYVCREEDYPKVKHEDWEYLVDAFDFEANKAPDFVKKNSPAKALMQSGSCMVISLAIRSVQFSDSSRSPALRRISARRVPRCSTPTVAAAGLENSKRDATRT